MSKQYTQITRFLSEKPWAILPSTLAVMRDLVAMRVAGEQFTKDEIRERIAVAPLAKSRGSRASASSRPQTIAVLPVYGVIVPKADMFSDISGASTISGMRDALAEAVGDPDVAAIVLDVDSPGGQVDLVTEFAAEIRAARAQKPIVAVSNTLMASAAYWIAAQATEIFVSPSSLTGSIGVYSVHDDLSAAQEQEGVKSTIVSAGKYKTEGNSFEPLSDEALGHIQSIVDSAYQAFTSDVARGRGAPVDAVRNGYGEGRVLPAKDAVSSGMADSVGTLGDAISRAAELASDTPTGAARRAAHDTGLLLVSVTGGAEEIDQETGAGGTDSIDEDEFGALRASEQLVRNGRRVTAAKRDRVVAIRDRCDAVLAAHESSDLDIQVAAMRARARVAATTLKG
jgi:signal peptide peptidase SppA